MFLFHSKYISLCAMDDATAHNSTYITSTVCRSATSGTGKTSLQLSRRSQLSFLLLCRASIVFQALPFLPFLSYALTSVSFDVLSVCMLLRAGGDGLS